MENVMVNGFAELSSLELNEIEGGFVVTLPTLVTLGGCVAAGYATGYWYKKVAVPKLEEFGGWCYDVTH